MFATLWAWLAFCILVPDHLGRYEWPVWIFGLSMYIATVTRSLRHGSDRTTTPHPRDPRAHPRSLARRAIRGAFYALTGGAPYSSDPGVIVEGGLPILAVRRVDFMPITSKRSPDRLLPGEEYIQGWELTSLNSSWGLKPYDTAVCSFGRAHLAPNWACTCGFYAVPADQINSHGYLGLIAEVELTGVVIEHEGGYRAEHQRIVGLYWDDKTHWFSAELGVPWFAEAFGISIDMAASAKAHLERAYGVEIKSWKEHTRGT